MATIPVTFIDAATGREVDADVPDYATREQILATLNHLNFLPVLGSATQQHRVDVQNKGALAEGTPISRAGVAPGDRIVIAVQQQGGRWIP